MTRSPADVQRAVNDFPTMMLPKDVQPVLDHLLAKYDPAKRFERHPTFLALARYCRAEELPQAWVALHDYGEKPLRGYEIFLAEEWDVISAGFSDNNLRDQRGWSESRTIADADRLREIRRSVRQAVTMHDEDSEPYACGGLPVRSTAGQEVVLGFAFRESTFGADWHWFGVFDDAAELRDWMRRSGWCTGMADLKEREGELLAAWERG
jgi:hypothetical protein